jgi:hypothetical protein
MPVATFLEYARSIEEVVNSAVATGDARLVSLQVDQRSVVRGLISGSLQFDDGSTLSGIEISAVPSLSSVLDQILRRYE